MAVFMKYLGLLGLIIIGVLFFVVLIRLPYFFIKYVKCYCKVTRELRESTTQQKNAIQHLRGDNLRGDKKEMKRQSVALDTKIRLLSFKESLFLWPKEWKILVFVSLIVAVLQASLSVGNWQWWKSDVSVFFMLVSGSLLGVLFLLSPVIGVFFVTLTGKLRKTLQQLEEAIEQRDKALRMQNAVGGKDDQ